MKKIISVMAVWDEQNMIALSIESTKDIIYEYIIVIKKGIDKTRQVLEHCRDVWGLRMKIIESELKLREARKLCFKLAEKYADYYLIQDGDEIYFTTKELQEMGRQSILDLIEANYDHALSCMIYLRKDLRYTAVDLTWLIEHPFLIKNIPEIIWPEHGDLPYIRFDWAKRKYRTFHTYNQTTPFKFDCNIKNFRRLFLRQVFTPWHDGNNTCTIEEYCLQNSTQCIDYRRNIRETNDIEEIISYFEEGDDPYLFCKLYNEKDYYAYPEVIKKYIESGFTKGIENIEDLPIMVSNDPDESKVSLENKIKKIENHLLANKERLEKVQQKRDDCNNKDDAYGEMIRLNNVMAKLNIVQEEIQYTLNCSTSLLIKKQSEQNIYKSYCIVYSKSEMRLNNYYKCKQIIPELTYIDAVDTITNYDLYRNIALDKKLLTEAYIDANLYYKGKIGCNISHMFVLDDFIKKKNVEWTLVIEDDLELIDYNKYTINWLIEKANENNSHFIQLCTDQRFIEEQLQKEKVDENLYLMVPQWGASAYLISKTGAKRVIESFPLEENIDGVYSKQISRLRSLCYLNQIFINKGDTEPSQKGEFGSIIWGTERH